MYVADFGENRIAEFTPSGTWIGAWGGGVLDGQPRAERCTAHCQFATSGADGGFFEGPSSVATDAAGNVYVVDYGDDRIQVFSTDGTFLRTWGWGVASGAARLETCTSGCRAGLEGAGAGELNHPWAIAVDAAGHVYVTELLSARVSEFTTSGGFVRAWGWGVLDGKAALETCTTTCQAGLGGWGAGELRFPKGVAVDGSGTVLVADQSRAQVLTYFTGHRVAVTVSARGSSPARRLGSPAPLCAPLHSWPTPR